MAVAVKFKRDKVNKKEKISRQIPAAPVVYNIESWENKKLNEQLRRMIVVTTDQDTLDSMLKRLDMIEKKLNNIEKLCYANNELLKKLTEKQEVEKKKSKRKVVRKNGKHK